MSQEQSSMHNLWRIKGAKNRADRRSNRIRICHYNHRIATIIHTILPNKRNMKTSLIEEMEWSSELLNDHLYILDILLEKSFWLENTAKKPRSKLPSVHLIRTTTLTYEGEMVEKIEQIKDLIDGVCASDYLWNLYIQFLKSISKERQSSEKYPKFPQFLFEEQSPILKLWGRKRPSAFCTTFFSFHIAGLIFWDADLIVASN